MRDTTHRAGNGNLYKILLLASLAALAVLAVVFWSPLYELTLRTTRFLMDKEGARQYILSHQPYSAIYFIGLQILQVVISPIPGELSCLAGGFIFGWAKGFVHSTIGLTLGSLIVVTIGRVFERVFLEKFIPKRILDNFEDRSRRWGLLTVLILFLVPGAPKDSLSYLFGLTRIPIPQFLLVSALARMPGTLVLSLQGATIFQGDWTFFLVMTLGGAAVVIPLLIFRDKIFRRFGIIDRPAG